MKAFVAPNLDASRLPAVPCDPEESSILVHLGVEG